MKRIETFLQYQELMNATRMKYRILFSNNYYMLEEVQRYIELSRMYYEELDGGLILIYDEERYYRVCLYILQEAAFRIPDLNKRVVLRNIYRKNQKDDMTESVEKRLEALEFQHTGTTVQLRGNVHEIWEKCKCQERFVMAMERKGYCCMEAPREKCAELEQFLIKSEIIKDYHIDYLEAQNYQEGSYMYLMSPNNELCAVSAATIRDGVAYGIGIAIEDKYKLKGLTSVLGYYRAKWLYDNEIRNIRAWALVTNDASLQYHTSLGYTLSNRLADEWVRGAKK